MAGKFKDRKRKTKKGSSNASLWSCSPYGIRMLTPPEGDQHPDKQRFVGARATRMKTWHPNNLPAGFQSAQQPLRPLCHRYTFASAAAASPGLNSLACFPKPGRYSGFLFLYTTAAARARPMKCSAPCAGCDGSGGFVRPWSGHGTGGPSSRNKGCIRRKAWGEIKKAKCRCASLYVSDDVARTGFEPVLPG